MSWCPTDWFQLATCSDDHALRIWGLHKAEPAVRAQELEQEPACAPEAGGCSGLSGRLGKDACMRGGVLYACSALRWSATCSLSPGTEEQLS